MRRLFVPQEFKGNADVLPEHKAVLHADHVVVSFWVLVPQVFEDSHFLLPIFTKPRTHITLFLRWCTSPRAATSVGHAGDIKQKCISCLIPCTYMNVKAMVRGSRSTASTLGRFPGEPFMVILWYRPYYIIYYSFFVVVCPLVIYVFVVCCAGVSLFYHLTLAGCVGA